MHLARLADPIDATDALLEAHRVPRQLEVHHEPAAMLQVEALAGRVRGEEHAEAAAREAAEDGRALGAIEAAVQDAGLLAEGLLQRLAACRDTR